MKRHLLDTSVLGAYLLGRSWAVSVVDPWVLADEAATSIVVYGEVAERLKRMPDFSIRRIQLRTILVDIWPYTLTYAVMERYADLRLQMRAPYGPGLIGDADTLIAATALERRLTVVTIDSDYRRVPGLSVQTLIRS